MRLSDEDLRGGTVIAADGQAVGETAALFHDSDVWRVESLQIKLRKHVSDQLSVRGVPPGRSRWTAPGCAWRKLPATMIGFAGHIQNRPRY